MIRLASVIGLPAENAQEYERLHAEVWPGVLERLRSSHMTNYSIFRMGELLFSYLEYVGEDLDADNAAIAADEATKQWWAICEPLQRPLDGRAPGEWWKPIPEVFHLD
ncbi:MAG: L-rhamnose mutarotase [Lacisediminihabitans sp.]